MDEAVPERAFPLVPLLTPQQVAQIAGETEEEFLSHIEEELKRLTRKHPIQRVHYRSPLMRP